MDKHLFMSETDWCMYQLHLIMASPLAQLTAEFFLYIFFEENQLENQKKSWRIEI